MERQMEGAFSVSALNAYVHRMLEGDPTLKNVTVHGELSGYVQHSSGHRYFTLKDAGAMVNCVMFRGNAQSLRFLPVDGMQVSVRATAELYAPYGKYQLKVTAMEKLGVGGLYQRYEELKAKLEKEGLFDPEIKKPLPFMPKCIGIATSRTGAVIHDMIRTAWQRDPNMSFVVAPCKVEGVGSAESIVAAIRALNEDGRPDVILCGRGGGKIEELWSFNEEIVARAIANSRLPVITCVGHSRDNTIADLVSDLSVVTPTAAAQAAVPVVSELRENLHHLVVRLSAALAQAGRLRRAELGRVWASRAFQDPEGAVIRQRREQVLRLWEKAGAAQRELLRRHRAELARLEAKVEALNPEGVLRRGYACVSAGGHVLSSAGELTPGMQIDIRLRDGSALAEVLTTTIVEDDDGK